MIRDDDLSVTRVCREQGLVDSAVRRSLGPVRRRASRWCRYRQAADARAAAHPQMEAENRELRLDNDFLKKASAFFARELKRSGG